MPLQKLDTNPPNGGREHSHLLSPIGYDDDASSIHSRSDQDTDSEDDELILRARNSRELRARDRIVLMEEEEMDRLVTDTRRKQERERRGSGLNMPNPLKMFGRRPSTPQESAVNESSEDLTNARRNVRRIRRQEKKNRLMESAIHGEDGELMYEMEEGGMKDGSSTGESSEREDSDEVDRRQLNMIAHAKAERRRSWRRWVLIHALIAIGFAILVLAAWKLSKDRKSLHVRPQNVMSNGTALFGPTTLIISLDGFRADFLQRGLTPRLNAFIAEGVSPKYMHPSFPSVTFPNHYTIATGLYPESHGIVGNSFWDPSLSMEFYYTDPDRSLDPKWWGGEPFWVTAEKQGIRTAIHMWPGSEAHILATEPSLVDKYNGKELLEKKVSRIMEFLDMPGLEDKTASLEDMRPQLIAAYVPNVDADGHRYGPNSTEIRDTISSVDTMMDQIFQGLEARNLTDIVNVIVVSDHGMATTDVTRMMQLEDLLDTSKIEHIDGWPLYGLRPKDPADLQELYDGLAEKASTNPNFEVYLRDVNMPERYHFANNDRIAPLWIVPKTGWAIVTKDEFSVQEGLEQGLVYHPRGLHGYDHEHPLMRAIFIARGPAFPHPANSQVEVFQNIEVYNMLCDSLGMEPKPNNGTLRLPLKTIGFHKPEDTPETPEDPVPTGPTAGLAASAGPSSPAGAKPSAEVERPTIPVVLSQSTSGATLPPEVSQPTAPQQSTESTPTKATAPTESAPSQDNDASDGDTDGDSNGFWDWLTDKVDKIWGKITGSGSS